jgi:chorismate dehydratase
MSKRLRLGLTQEIYCQPIFHGLSEQPAFACTVDVVAKNAIRMREHELDGAFLSPVDYARESSNYCIIPEVGIASREATDTISLHFKEGLHTIKSMAVQPTSTSEIVLATILLSERFDVHPQIVPSMGSLDQMLQTADAALLVGDHALDLPGGHGNSLDLVEEWFDMTGLPYVHGFWCVREVDFSRDGVARIQQARQKGTESLQEVVETAMTRHAQRVTAESLQAHLDAFSYVLSDEDQEGLGEFLRFAYYHGILPDVADINFYPLDQQATPPPTDPSLN